ncbi:hypothetical protein HDE_13041 [Halotydeus destructor]|nr:hypothetical protein HDE_13041 [Halotydeus destructor]
MRLLGGVLLIALFALTACKESEGIVDKISDSLPNLDSLHDAFEKAKDSGVEGYEKFVDVLKDQRRKIDEFYHPEKKKTNWEKTKEHYENLVDKVKEWNCKAEEKLHELRFGTSDFSCEDRTFAQKATDKASDMYDKAKDSVADTVKAIPGVEDLESAFNTARLQGTDGLKELVKSITDQRTRLEKMYKDVLSKAEKNTDTSSDKYKQWRTKFEESAGDSLRKLREMGDEFEQRIQDFMGSDHSRWGWVSKFKFW